MISANKILGSIIYRTREALRKDKRFLNGLKDNPYSGNFFPNGNFNITHYPGTTQEIKNNLLTMDKDKALKEYKFPGIFNYESKRQDVSHNSRTIYYNIAIVAPVLSSWLTEQREKFVFDTVLRPIYNELLNQLKKVPFIKSPYDYPTHTMYEVFSTGQDSNVTILSYGDWIDAIELHSVMVNVEECILERYKDIIEKENNLLIEL